MIPKSKILSILKPLALLGILILSGAYILAKIEGLPFGESIYYTFLLVSTVTHYPVTTTAGKIISAILVLLGLGLILYTVTTVTRILMEIDVEQVLKIELRKPRKKLNKNETRD